MSKKEHFWKHLASTMGYSSLTDAIAGVHNTNKVGGKLL